MWKVFLTYSSGLEMRTLIGFQNICVQTRIALWHICIPVFLEKKLLVSWINRLWIFFTNGSNDWMSLCTLCSGLYLAYKPIQTQLNVLWNIEIIYGASLFRNKPNIHKLFRHALKKIMWCLLSHKYMKYNNAILKFSSKKWIAML